MVFKKYAKLCFTNISKFPTDSYILKYKSMISLNSDFYVALSNFQIVLHHLRKNCSSSKLRNLLKKSNK